MTRFRTGIRYLSGISFKKKLIWIYSLITILMSFLTGCIFYCVSVEQVTDIAQSMAYEIQQKNIHILDGRLTKIKENSVQAVTDENLFAYLSNEELLAKENYLGLDRKITQILNKYFSSGDVLSVQLITEHYVYGVNTNLLTLQRFRESPVYRKALSQNGALLWTPVYDIVNMYQLDEYKEARLPDRWVFSAVRTIGAGYVNSQGYFVENPSESHLPSVLLINFSEEILKGILQDSASIQGIETWLLSPDAEVVYNNGSNLRDTSFPAELIHKIDGKKQGTDIITLDGEDTVISYVTSDVTGWISVAVMPSSMLMQATQIKMQVITATIMLTAMLAGILLSSLISSMVTRPIRQTVLAMQKLGAGHFGTQLTIASQDEFGYLANGFNIMDQHISRLIEDNYASKLRQKEMELLALNLQLNPHFLYNTLSVINYEALSAGDEKVSDMIMHLCGMLNYTLRNNSETSTLKEELQWVKDYVEIMMLRFENKFTVTYQTDDTLSDLQVPKLFLQPFVENSILHGFETIDSGGKIEVAAWKTQEKCLIEIWDNGIGIQNPGDLVKNGTPSGSIGIANIHQRIQLLFGTEYGVQIESEEGLETRVQISLPVNFKQ